MFSLHQKQSLTVKIFFAMVMGVLTGMFWGRYACELRFIGEIYLRLLRFCVMPIVLTTSIITVCSAKDIKTLGRIGLYTCLIFIGMMVLSGIVGSFFGIFFRPGTGVQLTTQTHVEVPPITFWQEIIVQFFPENLLQALANGNVFLILFVGTLCGISIVKMGVKGTRLSENIALWGTMVRKLVSIIFSFTPLGVFALMASVVGQYGASILSLLAKLILTFYGSCAFWLLFVHIPLVYFASSFTPLRFLRRSTNLILCCIGTCSSTSIIPVNLDTAREQFHISPIIANFVIPLGSQINKNGLGLLFPCLYAFACQATGIPVFASHLGIVILLTLLFVLSGGNGGIPAGGVLMITMIFSAMGLPMELVTLISGIYRFLDMGTTTMNCLGDLVVSLVLDSLDKKKKIFSLQL